MYFDTANGDVFHRRGSFGRSKYRVRRYGSSPVVFLERKLRRPGVLAKRRTLVPIEALDRLQAGTDPGWNGSWFHRRLLLRQIRRCARCRIRALARVASTTAGAARLTLDERVSAAPIAVPTLAPADGVPVARGPVDPRAQVRPRPADGLPPARRDLQARPPACVQVPHGRGGARAASGFPLVIAGAIDEGRKYACLTGSALFVPADPGALLAHLMAGDSRSRWCRPDRRRRLPAQPADGRRSGIVRRHAGAADDPHRDGDAGHRRQRRARLQPGRRAVDRAVPHRRPRHAGHGLRDLRGRDRHGGGRESPAVAMCGLVVVAFAALVADEARAAPAGAAPTEVLPFVLRVRTGARRRRRDAARPDAATSSARVACSRWHGAAGLSIDAAYGAALRPSESAEALVKCDRTGSKACRACAVGARSG